MLETDDIRLLLVGDDGLKTTIPEFAIAPPGIRNSIPLPEAVDVILEYVVGTEFTVPSVEWI